MPCSGAAEGVASGVGEFETIGVPVCGLFGQRWGDHCVEGVVKVRAQRRRYWWSCGEVGSHDGGLIGARERRLAGEQLEQCASQ